MEKKTRWRLIGAAAVLGVVAVAAHTLTRGSFEWRERGLVADLRHPDVLLRSEKLSQMPRDLASAPMLQGVLSEDFVHYYEDHPTQLSLTGTFKRLAYDHKLTVVDRLAATVLNAPGELALWRDGQGRPSYFALLLEHNAATRATLELAKVALPDKQLTVAGEVGSLMSKTTVYALTLDSRNTWLFATRGPRTVVLSHPGLLLDGKQSMSSEAAAMLDKALSTAPGGASPFAQDFGLAERGAARHQLVAKTDFLSFGYQHFFPAVAALKAELGPKGWAISARTEGAAIAPWRTGAGRLWSRLPRSSALCAALPIDPTLMLPVLAATDAEGITPLLKDLEPIGAVCWNTTGGLFAPLLALQLRPEAAAKHDAVLERLISQVTRASPAAGKAAEGSKRPIAGPVQKQALPKQAGVMWTRSIAHEFGAVKQGNQRVNVVGLVRSGDLVLASTDARNLQLALAVVGKTQAALSDVAMPGAAPLLAIDGPQLSRMLEAETWRTLKPAAAPTFNRVARELLPPRLEAVSQLGLVQLGLPASAVGAKGMQWVDLPVQRTAPAIAAAPAARSKPAQ